MQKHLFASLLVVAIAFATSAVSAEPVRFGSLLMDLPAGYAVKSTQVPFELVSPSGAKVLITIMRLGKEASESAGPVDIAKLTSMNERFLTVQAQKTGKVTVGLALETLPDGSTLQYVGSEVSRLFKNGYFLQYLVTSPGGRIGFLTFEGTGDPVKEHEGIKSIFQSVAWAP